MNLALEELEVYRLSEEVADAIWRVVATWNWFEKSTIGKQITRAADSIGANIAEGYGRFSFKENLQFCHYARGSLFETKFFIRRTYSRGILNNEQYEVLANDLERLGRLLNGYIRSNRSQLTNRIA